MSIWGNVTLPQKDGFIYGAKEPGVPCLWFNTAGAEVPADPDVAHGMLLYRDSDDVLHPLYPMTTMAAVYGLKKYLEDFEIAYKDDGKELKKQLNAAIGSTSVSLPADGWNEKTITVNVDGVTETNTVIVSCAAESYEAYCEAAVRCSGQGGGTLSFVCEFVPASAVTVNVVILNEVST